jgi:hypothetical protein
MNLKPAAIKQAALIQLLARLLKRRNKQQIQMVPLMKKSTQMDQLLKTTTQNPKLVMSYD